MGQMTGVLTVPPPPPGYAVWGINYATPDGRVHRALQESGEPYPNDAVYVLPNEHRLAIGLLAAWEHYRAHGAPSDAAPK